MPDDTPIHRPLPDSSELKGTVLATIHCGPSRALILTRISDNVFGFYTLFKRDGGVKLNANLRPWQLAPLGSAIVRALGLAAGALEGERPPTGAGNAAAPTRPADAPEGEGGPDHA